MCTVVVLRRSQHDWPLLIAANRDEMIDRAWAPPARYWPERPTVVAGRDELAGGTWLGVNDHGVVAAVLNRLRSLGPTPDTRSRGELPLIALEFDSARSAAAALAHINPADYRPFHLIIADAAAAYWLRVGMSDETGDASAELTVSRLPEGLSMITAYDRNDTASPRIRRYLPRFEAASIPDPDHDRWSAWQDLLASSESDEVSGPGGAMNVVTETGFGTVSSSLLAAQPASPGNARIRWLFAAGRPGATPYTRIEL